MRSRDDAIGDAVERAIAYGVCGVGGRLDSVPATLHEAIKDTDALLGERTARRLERFAGAPENAFVWTRDARDLLWLGRISGPWRYDAAADAAAVDLVNVRPCDWAGAPIPHDRAPAPVHATFARGGRNWQRIRSSDAEILTARIWREGCAGDA